MKPCIIIKKQAEQLEHMCVGYEKRYLSIKVLLVCTLQSQAVPERCSLETCGCGRRMVLDL